MHHHLRPNAYDYGGYITFISITIITILDTWGHVYFWKKLTLLKFDMQN